MTLYKKAGVILGLLFGISACAQLEAPSVEADDFVRVDGTRFVLEGEPYYFVGTNFWYGAYLGSPGPEGDRERLLKELDTLKASGITNLRVLAASESSELMRAVQPALIREPGEYNDNLLEGLDFLLAAMGKRDMKAVLYLNNFWQWSGGMSQYVAWFTGEEVLDPDKTGEWNAFMENSARFYRMEEAQALYRDVIETIITRRNSVTGQYYYEDPTVMSWQLANEPRPGSDEHGRPYFQDFKQWVHETARYIDSLAPHQLVSTGNEGAMGTLRDEDLYIIAHASPYVDYLTFHMWLKNWSWFDIHNPEETYDSAIEKAQAYMNRHIDIANKMNKPTVLSEFGAERDEGAFEPGTPTTYRDRIYREVFDLVYERAAEGDAIAGTNFWTWGGLGRAGQEDFMWAQGDDFTGDPPQEHQGLNSVFDADDSTMKIIRKHAEKMHQLSNH
ncbi:glycoside hydrolase 5 family protein [Marinimicrobium sp. C2-29]|uniref:glycoside hydrolase 5 family protein n=1 Tax=Marinimicrobium sp. C2-29 TaxID=3139825 RepID=UPI0031392243